jgi:hypothetical protein
MKKFYGEFEGKNVKAGCSGKIPDLIYFGCGLIAGCMIMRIVVFSILGI